MAAVILQRFTQIAETTQPKSLPPLTDDLWLPTSATTRLAIAILFARPIEEDAGFDPFTESDDFAYP